MPNRDDQEYKKPAEATALSHQRVALMLLTVCFIAICLSLLGLTVYGLYQHQLKAGSVNAERYAPLGLGDCDADLHSLKIYEPETVDLIAPIGLDVENNNFTQQTVTQRLADDLPEAAYPLLGAYNQRCLSLRKALKTNIGDFEQTKKLLNALYLNAAAAELLHGKTSHGKMSLSKLKMLPEQFVDELDMPYKLIGYRKLKLLCKTDIKRLLQMWGEPEAHQCPRDYHRRRWDELYQRYG